MDNPIGRSSNSRTAIRARPARALLLLSLALVLGACASPATDAALATGVRVVSPGDAEQLLASDPAPVLIDVRTPEEFAAGHLAGAELVDFNAPDFREQISDYARDASYVIYCRSGNRSAGARAVMTELGFTDVADIDGGIVAWTQAGLPVTT